MPNGSTVDVPVADPKKMTVSQFRGELEKAIPEGDQKVFARVISLCKPHAISSIDPTPILPLDPNKTLHEQGVYSWMFDVVELPQSYFSYVVVESGEPLVIAGCSWSNPEDVLADSKSPYRLYKEKMGNNPSPGKKEPSEEKRGKSAHAYSSPELARAAKQKVRVVSDDYFTFSVEYNPESSVRYIFPRRGDQTTVADLRKAVRFAVEQETKDMRIASSIPLCLPKPIDGKYSMSDDQKLADVFGEDQIDLNLYSPAQWIRVIVGVQEYNVGVCPGTSRPEFEQQTRLRLGVTLDAPIVYVTAETVSGTVDNAQETKLSELVFSSGHAPTRRIRIAEFLAKYILAEDQPMTHATSPIGKLGGMVLDGGRKIFGDRRIVLALLIVIFGLILIVFGTSSSFSTADPEFEPVEEKLKEPWVVSGGHDGLDAPMDIPAIPSSLNVQEINEEFMAEPPTIPSSTVEEEKAISDALMDNMQSPTSEQQSEMQSETFLSNSASKDKVLNELESVEDAQQEQSDALPEADHPQRTTAIDEEEKGNS